MALEDLTGNKYIDALDSANPVGATDFVSTADDHLRGLKNVLKKTFPNLNAEVSANPAELNKLDGFTGTLAELNFLVGVTSLIQTQLDNLASLKADLAAPSFTGTVNSAGLMVLADALTVALTATISGNLILNAGYNEDSVSLGLGGVSDVDLDAGSTFYTGILTSIPVFTFSNPVTSGRMSSFHLELNNALNFAPIWPSEVSWSNGNEPVWTAGKDVVSFTTRDGGTVWLGYLGGLAFV